MHPHKHWELVEEDRGSDDKPGPSRDVTTKSVQLTFIVEMATFSLCIAKEKGASIWLTTLPAKEQGFTVHKESLLRQAPIMFTR